MAPEVAAALIAGGFGVLTFAGTLIVQVRSSRRASRDNAETLKQQRKQSDATLKQQREQSDATLKQQREQSDATLKQQREQLETTLAAQRDQLDTTLEDQRQQLRDTLAQQRDRTLNERFATAADRLGSDRPPAVRLAGVHAMAGLADDWPENRQTCVDVLCAYLRLPHDPDPGDGADLADRNA